MKGKSVWLYLALPLLLCLLLLRTAQAAVEVFIGQDGDLVMVNDPSITDPVAAVRALAAGPSAVWGAAGLYSAIPRGTTVQRFDVDDKSVTVDFSDAMLSGGLDEAMLEDVFKQVTWTLDQFDLPRDVKLTVNGQSMYSYLPATPIIVPRAGTESIEVLAVTGSLTGHSITLSPGHGKYWNGSGWYTARPVYCSPLTEEDYHNIDNATYLQTYLEQDGMLVKMVRCTNKSYGASPYNGGEVWWHMAASYWLKQIGYPCTVYASYTGDCTLGTNASESSDDIRARPLASDYDGTNIYVSLHTNGLAGNCTGVTCPTGSDTYYDCSTEHASWCTVSQNLSNSVHPAMISAIRNEVGDSGWVDRGQHDSNGAYGEIRIPDRAAILIELAFHDTCDNDAIHLRDPWWVSGSMWGIYKGICTYFGHTPTWGFYSDEYVSDDIPTQMSPGEVRQVHVTFRNKGVVWNETHAIRLGAVGDSDPFSAATRYTISGNVAPGSTYTFTVNFTAPTTPGYYTTDWRMVRDAVTWFGATLTKQVQVTGGDTTPPSVPTNLAASAVSDTQINLTWTASTDDVGVTGYKVFRNGSQIGTSPSASYSDTTCSPATTYTYEVSAYDAAGNESAKSAAAIATTPDTIAPTAPTNLSATAVSQTQINLAWTASTDNVGVTGYKVFRNGAQIGTSGTTSYSDTSCSSYTTYTYQVSAYDAAGNQSGLSNQAVATTLPYTDIVVDNPAATFVGSWFTGTSATDKYGADYRYCTTDITETKTATWTPDIDISGYYTVYCWYPQGSNRSTMAPFTVYWDGGSQTVNVNQQTNGGQWVTLVTNKRFMAGTAGYIKLGNGTGESLLSVMADAVRFLLVSSDLTPPSVPTNLAATAVSASQINLTWTASTDNVGVTGYRIFRNGAAVGTSASTSYSDTGLTQLTTYTYTVSAYDAMGNESAQSSSASATTWDGQAPTVPTGLTATAVGPTRINLAWTASTDNVGVTGYKIYRGATQIGTSATTSYSDGTCSPSTAYSYQVSAYDARGNESAKSAVASATTPAFAQVIVDNPAATYVGTWSTGTSATDKYGADYRYCTTATTETKTATWRPSIPYSGRYDVYVWYPQGTNRSTKAPYTVYWNGGSQTVPVNQQTNGGKWNLIVSNQSFLAGTAGYIKLGNGTAEVSLNVMADAVRFMQVGGD